MAGYDVDVTFDRVHLLQEGGGRVWTPIADAPFSGPAVVGRGGLPVELAVTVQPDVEVRAFAAREWPVYDRGEFGHVVLDERRPFTIAARRDGEIVGMAEGWTGGGVAYLANLIVAASHRGEGIGTQLLATFESLAAERGCPRLGLRALGGARAEAFYRGRGWVEEARVRDWEFGRDQLLMRRDL
jgi:GNAT superfamily N-acetyltransferase